MISSNFSLVLNSRFFEQFWDLNQMFKHSRLKYNCFQIFFSNCFQRHNDYNSHIHDVYKTDLHYLLLDDAFCLIMRASHFMIYFQKYYFSILFSYENITFFEMFTKIQRNDTIFSWHSNSQRANFIEQKEFFKSRNIFQDIVSQYNSILFHENIITKK